MKIKGKRGDEWEHIGNECMNGHNNMIVVKSNYIQQQCGHCKKYTTFK